MAQIEYLDNLLKEYLMFRGFSSTLRALDFEQKNDKDKSFRAEKILEQCNIFINNHDLQSLRELWSHLDTNLFSKLEHTYAEAVKKLENGLLKLYLVTAYTNNRTDKISDFFVKLAPEIRSQSEWKEWFYLPFCKNAEELPTFAHYFSKQWQETLQISLRNFLTTIYQCIPQPTIVKAEHEASLIRRLQEDNSNLKARIQTLQQQQQQQMQQLSSSTSGSNQNLNQLPANENFKRGRSATKPQSLNDISPFDVSPPGHIVDDFFIIASETINIAQYPDAQARGLKMLIKNIGSNNSPVMGRKETNDKSKKRSGSVGRTWI